jgi:dCTP deaminase
MSIKSDKWIRRMAETTGMIEPFEPGQIRQADGKKIISYGTSSYGYDIRRVQGVYQHPQHSRRPEKL